MSGLSARVVAHQDSRMRAGRQFHREPSSIPVAELTREEIDALRTDPLLTLTFVASNGEQDIEIGSNLTDEQLDELLASSALLEEAAKFEASKVDPSTVPGTVIPDPAGSDPAQAPGAAADQTKDAADDEANSADTGGASTAAAADGGSSAGGNGEDGKAATADAAPSAEENNGGADPAPVPVAAPKSKPSGRKPRGKAGAG